MAGIGFLAGMGLARKAMDDRTEYDRDQDYKGKDQQNRLGLQDLSMNSVRQQTRQMTMQNDDAERLQKALAGSRDAMANGGGWRAGSKYLADNGFTDQAGQLAATGSGMEKLGQVDFLRSLQEGDTAGAIAKNNTVNPNNQLERIDMTPIMDDKNKPTGDFNVQHIRKDGKQVPSYKLSDHLNFQGMLAQPRIVPAGSMLERNGQLIPGSRVDKDDPNPQHKWLVTKGAEGHPDIVRHSSTGALLGGEDDLSGVTHQQASDGFDVLNKWISQDKMAMDPEKTQALMANAQRRFAEYINNGLTDQRGFPVDARSAMTLALQVESGTLSKADFDASYHLKPPKGAGVQQQYSAAQMPPGAVKGKMGGVDGYMLNGKFTPFPAAPGATAAPAAAAPKPAKPAGPDAATLAAVPRGLQRMDKPTLLKRQQLLQAYLRGEKVSTGAGFISRETATQELAAIEKWLPFAEEAQVVAPAEHLPYKDGGVVKGYAGGGVVNNEPYDLLEPQSNSVRASDGDVQPWLRGEGGPAVQNLPYYPRPASPDDAPPLQNMPYYPKEGVSSGDALTPVSDQQPSVSVSATPVYENTMSAQPTTALTPPVPQAVNDDQLSFNQAFAKHAKAGESGFVWRGKNFTTQLARTPMALPKPAAAPQAAPPAAPTTAPPAALALPKPAPTPQRSTRISPTDSATMDRLKKATDQIDIDKLSKQENVPAEVLHAFAAHESGNNPNAVGPKTDPNGIHKGGRARGMFQVMEGTFNQHAKPGEKFSNPADVARVGARILGQYYRDYGGDMKKVATAFFAGPGSVSRAAAGRLRDSTGTSVRAYQRGIDKQMGLQKRQRLAEE